jgi:hypothetical protein
LYRSIIQESDFLTERSSLSVNLRLILFQVPGLWHDVGEVITGSGLFDDEAIQLLEYRCRLIHRGFIDWMEDYKAHCVRLVS